MTAQEESQDVGNMDVDGLGGEEKQEPMSAQLDKVCLCELKFSSQKYWETNLIFKAFVKSFPFRLSPQSGTCWCRVSQALGQRSCMSQQYPCTASWIRRTWVYGCHR